MDEQDGGGVIPNTLVNVHSHEMSSYGVLVVGTDLLVVSRV